MRIDEIQVVQTYLDDHSPELIAEDAVMNDHGSGELISGSDAIGERLYQMYEVVFPNAEAKLRSLSGGDGVVTLEFDFVGTNEGPFLGMPPTGNDVDVPMCVVYKVDEGRIQTIDVYFNAMTMMSQLGLAG